MEASIREVAVLVSAGCGLVLISAIQVFGNRWPWSVRAAVAAAITVTASLAPLAVANLEQTLATAAVIGLVWATYAVAASGRVGSAVQWAHRVAGWPGVRAAALAFVGGGLALGSVIKFDIADDASIAQDTAFVDSTISQPDTRVVEEIQAATDQGRVVRVREATEVRTDEARDTVEQRLLSEFRCYERVIRLAPANDSANCHGWVFTGGRYWVSQTDVEKILADNGYTVVTDPKPGDLAIYRDKLGMEIGHTAVVRAVMPGMQPLVEGKWAWMGVFLHRAGDSPYGTNYAFYRSTRDGHLLAGLDSLPNSKEAAEKLAGAQ